jgi:hypothetical protein
MPQMPDITTVAAKIFELAQVLNVTNINRLPGAWIYDVGKAWKIAVNGRQQDVDIPNDGVCMGATIPPYHLAIWYNGWLAGLMSPFDGILAAGSGANEETLIAALEAEIGRIKAEVQRG